MTIYFSPSKLAFFAGSLEADYKAAGTWPSDAVAITDTAYQTYTAQPAAGKTLGVVSGQPAWVDLPAPAAPTLAQQAAAASIAGVTLTLSGSMTLAATKFPTDLATQTKIGAVVNGINATGAFPDAASTFPMKDAAEPPAWHDFTIAQYKAVAGAILSYVSTCTLIADGNPLGAAALPSSSIALTV